MKEYKNMNFATERALYGAKEIRLVDCSFDGAEDGESALKETENVELVRCYMDLRYPLWHGRGVALSRVRMTDKCRAALWYTNNAAIDDSRLSGIKALRECASVAIRRSEIDSQEFGWRCRDVQITDSAVRGEYAFLLASGVKLQNVAFQGKYSFQYAENVQIADCTLDTKDAFWHAKNATVRNSALKGEYLAWYSENLTLIGCKIMGTQPFCYCKGLKLIDCEMIDTDLAFEYSDVDASVNGNIHSVKNPRSGRIVADGITDLIITDDSKYSCACEVVTRCDAEKAAV